jgi:site-specific DNA-methyltransferase (adenine-specific)
VIAPYYADDTVTLWHGDCLDVMRTMPSVSVDLVFTSPPYNLGGFNGGWKGDLADGYEDHADAMPHEAYVAWQRAVLRECWRLIRPTGAIYYQHKNIIRDGVIRTPAELIPDLPVRQVIVWDRSIGMNVAETHYLPVHELIYVVAGPAFRLTGKAASGLTGVWRVRPAANTAHPAPFPVSLPARAIASTGARTVLDPFVGSGSTLRAAADAGVTSIGIELSARYCDLAVGRLAQGALDFGGVA